MRINEIFDNSYDWSWVDMRGIAHKMFSIKTAAIGLGDVETAINPDRPSKLATVSGKMAATFDVGNDVIWVMFERNKPGHWVVMFDSQDNKLDKNKKYGNTNSGHASRILATVIDIIKDFIVHYEPELLHFVANDQKRAAIYRAIVKKIGSFNKYRADTEKRGSKGEHFALHR